MAGDAELDDYDLEVLRYLCLNGKCRNSVVLADEAMIGHEFGWIVTEQILAALNERGLVKYKIGEYGVFIDIRPTKHAYPVCGIEFKFIAEVGNRRPGETREQPQHPNDPTDFRNYGEEALGMGPVERMALDDHILTYEDHDHWRQYDECRERGILK